MSGFFKNVIIDVPSYKEQLEIVKKYDYLDSLQTKIMNTLVNIDRLFNREIVA
jgi:restriction endonuclease S subunit